MKSLGDIIKILVKNGCPDVTSQLEHIDDQPAHAGGLGDVYQGRLKGRSVAVKCLRMDNFDDKAKKVSKNTARELYTWSRVSHPNILKLHGLAMVRGRLSMVSPWMEYGSLLAYFNAKPEADRCNACAQVATGLAYIHKIHLVHGDIKCSNVVVPPDGTPKITDFGCATMQRRFAIAFTATQTLKFSIRWAAPELIREEGPASFETDVYALGKTVLEALTGELPHKNMSEFAVVMTVDEGKFPARPLDHIPFQSRKGNDLWDMLERCWNINPKLRPTVVEMRKFLSTITPEDLTDHFDDQPAALAT
ncbi:hypothetical protein FRC11_014581 [Ceratobasidium sp. 423]|nr:hypothetical protein FRC11_014581 [Ceratobasidium sp. 423]